MARARTIKPQFLCSHSMAQVSLGARLAFVHLWLIADDAGRVIDHPVALPRWLFPEDRSVQPLVMGWIDELARQHCIERYEVDRSGYLRIVNWRRHQKIYHPTPSRLPPRPPGPARAADVTLAIPSGAIREANMFFVGSRAACRAFARAAQRALARASQRAFARASQRALARGWAAR